MNWEDVSSLRKDQPSLSHYCPPRLQDMLWKNPFVHCENVLVLLSTKKLIVHQAGSKYRQDSPTEDAGRKKGGVSGCLLMQREQNGHMLRKGTKPYGKTQIISKGQFQCQSQLITTLSYLPSICINFKPLSDQFRVASGQENSAYKGTQSFIFT